MDMNILTLAVLEQSLGAMKKAMDCLTCEEEFEWRRSQKYDEAPYHFLYQAIITAEKKLK